MNIDYEAKLDRMTGFFVGALRMGYSLNDAWKLMLNSTEGTGILEENYTYSVHHQGITSAQKADKAHGQEYDHDSNEEDDIFRLSLLVDFIEMAHKRFNLSYSHIFDKMSIGDFYKECGIVLGSYDDKLLKTYLL